MGLEIHVILVCIPFPGQGCKLFTSSKMMRIPVAFMAIGKMAVQRCIMGLSVTGAAFHNHLVLSAMAIDTL